MASECWHFSATSRSSCGHFSSPVRGGLVCPRRSLVCGQRRTGLRYLLVPAFRSSRPRLGRSRVCLARVRRYRVCRLPAWCVHEHVGCEHARLTRGWQSRGTSLASFTSPPSVSAADCLPAAARGWTPSHPPAIAVACQIRPPPLYCPSRDPCRGSFLAASSDVPSIVSSREDEACSNRHGRRMVEEYQGKAVRRAGTPAATAAAPRVRGQLSCCAPREEPVAGGRTNGEEASQRGVAALKRRRARRIICRGTCARSRGGRCSRPAALAQPPGYVKSFGVHEGVL